LRRLLKVFAAVVLLAILTVAAILLLLWVQHRGGVTLPVPTGPFAVGRRTYVWVDQTRTDPLAPTAGIKRELVVWIWYPARPSAQAVAAEYQLAALRAAWADYQGPVIRNFLSRDPARIQAHSIRDAEIAPNQPAYPVLIMKPGKGMPATDYTAIAEDLASHGYVVAGNDQTYSTGVVVFPDGRIAHRTPAGNPPEDLPESESMRIFNRLIEVWSADTRFVLDQLARMNASDPSGIFTGRLDLKSAGVFGHSFGGATAAQFCHDDDRCRAGIDIDGRPFGTVVQEGLRQPFMFLLADHGRETDAVSRQILADIQSIYASVPAGALLLSIRGAAHFDSSDMALTRDRYTARTFGATGSIDERRALAITCVYVRAFFDTYLKHHPSTLLNGPSSVYPEVRLDARK